MIIKNLRGDIWEEMIDVDEKSISQFKPLTHSLIVVMYKEKSLLVFNRFKKHWELPGGMIDPGETARECAIRELKEEANQVVDNPMFIGVMKFLLVPDHWNKVVRTEYGTLFYSDINSENAFKENEEMSGLCFWNGVDDIGKIEPIDAKMIEIAKERRKSRRQRA